MYSEGIIFQWDVIFFKEATYPKGIESISGDLKERILAEFFEWRNNFGVTHESSVSKGNNG
jgi:hypothetical protein